MKKRVNNNTKKSRQMNNWDTDGPSFSSVQGKGDQMEGFE